MTAATIEKGRVMGFLDFLAKVLGNEAVKHPATVLVLLVLGGAALGVVSYQPFVMSDAFQEHVLDAGEQREDMKNTIDDIKRQIACLKSTVLRGQLEGRLQQTEAEYWSLERAVKEGSADSADAVRMDKLRSDTNMMNRQLQRIPACYE